MPRSSDFGFGRFIPLKTMHSVNDTKITEYWPQCAPVVFALGKLYETPLIYRIVAGTFSKSDLSPKGGEKSSRMRRAFLFLKMLLHRPYSPQIARLPDGDRQVVYLEQLFGLLFEVWSQQENGIETIRCTQDEKREVYTNIKDFMKDDYWLDPTLDSLGINPRNLRRTETRNLVLLQPGKKAIDFLTAFRTLFLNQLEPQANDQGRCVAAKVDFFVGQKDVDYNLIQITCRNHLQRSDQDRRPDPLGAQ